RENKINLLLKGAPSIVSDPEGRVYVNPTGNPGLASGGTGDVLTGMAAGLLAQGMKPLEAGYAANYLHGLVADEVAAKKTVYALTAGDIWENIGAVLHKHFDHH
ncbi:MAG: NAD(P)H-hydrate dehydratase, partial [Calditrichia bacterium]